MSAVTNEGIEGGTLIRPERTEDHAEVARVVSAAFGSSAEADLVEAIRASDNAVPEWSLVAEMSGRIVGHVMVSFVALLDGDVEWRVPTLSPLAVAPEVQRRGVGSALVRAVVPLVDGAGEGVLLLEGDPRYYRRFGFEYSVPLGISMDLPSWAPPEAAQVLRLARYDPRIRGHVVYPPAFHTVSGD